MRGLFSPYYYPCLTPFCAAMGRLKRGRTSILMPIPDKHRSMSDDDRKYVEQYGNVLSDTTRSQGKWVGSPDEHEDHKGQSLVTRNPEVIRQWAETRQAAPALAEGSSARGNGGVLRFDFPGFGGGNLRKITWDEWIDIFRKRELAFIFQEHTKDGNESNFFQLDNPHRERS